MFPLEQTVLPSAVVPLHIFEERYRALARDLAVQDEPAFGITMIARGREIGGGDQRCEVGVVARVVEAKEFFDGRWGMIVTATRRIRVESWLHDAPYPIAQVSDWPDTDTDLEAETLELLRAQLKRITDAARQIAGGRGIDEAMIRSDDPTYEAWQLVVAAQLGALDNQRLLAAGGWGLRGPLALDLMSQRADILEGLC